MTILSRDAILAADDRAIEPVEVPEWGGTVLVRALSGEDRDAFENGLSVRMPKLGKSGEFEMVPNLANTRARLVSLSIVDEAGSLVFSNGDIVALGAKSAAALGRVFDVASKLSGLGEDAVDEAKGNSEAVPSDGSTSDSPETSA